MVLLNLLVKPLWVFFIDRKVQLTIGNHTYGTFAALMNITILFNILLDLGITNYNNRAVAIEKKSIETAMPNMILAKLLLSFVYFVVILTVAISLQYTHQNIILLCWIGGIQFLNSMLLYLRSSIAAHQHFKMESFLSIADKLIMLIICSILLYGVYQTQFTIYHFVYTQIVAYAIVVVIAFVYIKTNYTSFIFKNIKTQSIVEIIKSSIPYAILILLMGIYMRSDAILIERLLPNEGAMQNGIYMLSFRILDVLNAIAILFASMLLPMFSKLIATKSSIHELVTTSMNILMPISCSIVAFSLFFHRDIILYLYHDVQMQSDTIFIFVMLSFPAFCLMYIYSTLLVANGNIRLLIKISAITAIINLVCNYVLITQFKALGAAYTLCITEWFVSIVCIFYGRKYFGLHFKVIWLFKFVVVFILYIVLNFVLKAVLNCSFIESALVNIVLFLPIVFLVKLWHFNTFKQYFFTNNVKTQ